MLVSDGGGKMQAEEEPKRDCGRHAYRVLDLIENQVRALRKRQVIGSDRSTGDTRSATPRAQPRQPGADTSAGVSYPAAGVQF